MISLRSKITKDVLGNFFLHEDNSLYINEIARLFGLDRGNLIRKLKDLECEGILKSEFKGNQKYYSLNKDYPLLAEYKKIILKTVGFENRIRNLLGGIKGIKEAYIFGSYVKGRLNASSDLDVLVVGRQDTIGLQKKIAQLQSYIGREINVVSIGEKEFLAKKNKDPLIKGILRAEKIRLI